LLLVIVIVDAFVTSDSFVVQGSIMEDAKVDEGKNQKELESRIKMQEHRIESRYSMGR